MNIFDDSNTKEFLIFNKKAPKDLIIDYAGNNITEYINTKKRSIHVIDLAGNDITNYINKNKRYRKTNNFF